jgi:hypothetical protein
MDRVHTVEDMIQLIDLEFMKQKKTKRSKLVVNKLVKQVKRLTRHKLLSSSESDEMTNEHSTHHSECKSAVCKLLDIEQDQIKNHPHVSSTRMKRQRYFINQKKRSLMIRDPSSSSSLNIDTTRQRLMSFTRKKKRHFKRKIQLQVNKKKLLNEFDKRQALVQIRQQIINFEIPAAWTCMRSSKSNSAINFL